MLPIVATAATRSGSAAAHASACGPPADHPTTPNRSRLERVGERTDVVAPVRDRAVLLAPGPVDAGAVGRDEAHLGSERAGARVLGVEAARQAAVAPDDGIAVGIPDLAVRESAPVRQRDLRGAGHVTTVVMNGVPRVRGVMTAYRLGEMQRYSRPSRAISSAGERCLHTAEAAGSKPASPTVFVLVTGLRSVARVHPGASRALRVP